MSAHVIPCPVCDEPTVLCDNSVRLDPAEGYSDDPAGACWSIMKLGPLEMASVGGPGLNALGMKVGHRLHEHQPKES